MSDDLAICRLMETRRCPLSGPCADICARFQSDDPTPWLEGAVKHNRQKAYEAVRSFGFDEFMSAQIVRRLDEKGLITPMPRNVFESNDPVPDEEDIKAVGNGPHIMLPPLAEGHRYALTDLPSGRQAVTVEEDETEDVSETYTPRRDQFGRKYTQ